MTLRNRLRRTGALRDLVLCLVLAASAPAVFGISDFYWEAPTTFSPGVARFPVAAVADGLAAVVWQESAPSGAGDAAGGQVMVSIAVHAVGSSWTVRRNVAGPYHYSGSEPSMLSLAIDGRGRLLLAATASPSETELLLSDDRGATFKKIRVPSEGLVSPRVYAAADGGYLLFATQGQDQSLSIFYSRSADGVSWTSFLPFVQDETLKLNFLPTHVAVGGEDFVVFQSLSSGDRPSFQLYLKRSSDGGTTWTKAKLVTSFQDPFGGERAGPEFFDNQRPYLGVVQGALYLVWERKTSAGTPQIYMAQLDRDGRLVDQADRVSNGSAYCNNPVVFEYEGEPALAWFDNRRGQDRAYLAQRNGVIWEDQDLSGSAASASFVRPTPTADGLFVFWQAVYRGIPRLFILQPDRSVLAPTLRTVDFRDGVRIREDRATVAWSVPDDSSGIAGYSFSWSQDPAATPPERIMALYNETRATRIATDDGSWYFSIRAQDYAGNWSAPATVEFVRDTTPPGFVNIVPPAIDEKGFLVSNTFALRWNSPPASDIAGYTYALEYLAPLEYEGVLRRIAEGKGSLYDFSLQASASFRPASPPRRTLTAAGTVSFQNQDDGIWAFSVAAVDTVGNIGPPSVIYFRTDKYVPHTYITYADAAVDEFGVLSLRIIGRGFSVGGKVGRIFLDRDGRAPYDREFRLDRGDYRIESDRSIAGLRIEDLEAGRYRIGLEHPTRGLYLSAPLVSVDEFGTVKFGDYSAPYDGAWTIARRRPWRVDPALLLVLALALFAAFGLVAFARGIAGVAREGVQIRLEVAALITGETMPIEEKERARSALRRRGAGLRLKLVAFTTGLVVMVVVLVSGPLMYFMTRNQEAILVRGLKDRSRVLLDSLASGAKAYLPAQNLLELGFLPDQAAAMSEARYATITGLGQSATVFADHVWATNDPDIVSKIDTAEFQPGVSRLTDALSPRLESIAKELDAQARAEVGDLSKGISDLTREGLSLALKTDPESVRRRDEIQAETRSLESQLNAKLSQIASAIGSEPAFDEDRLPRGTSSFIFFKPVMYRQGSEDQYFRGVVRIEVTTDSIVAEIAAARLNLVYIVLSVAAVAILIGLVGTLLMSSVIIRPLRRLVSHVQMIRDTENKEELEGKDIEVKTRDEIAVLGATINEMTHGLVKAAAASKDLTVGKEVQKMFIPLETDKLGRKLTSGKLDAPRAEFFGYYEGAKGVSGDYFDYVDLDGRYVAVIKCDIAGKGVPAALIMVEVATLFLDHFKNWKPTPEGFRLDKVVYRINDFLESRGFKGRFAAFTLCLMDTQTGILRFCNAGDNLVHYYDAAEARMKLLTLPETPTAGVFPNELIELKGGYAVQTHTLKKGDILLLYTDGIEEAQRHFRNERLEDIVCQESDGPDTETHGNHQRGEAVELLGYDRVEAILNAVLSRGRYELVKYHSSDPAARFTFDFGRCEGSVEDAIMALVSVEKVFRLFKDPKAQEDIRVLVDRKVDAFLSVVFDQYREYASRKKEHGEYEEYVYYTHLREDEQYDDLTILGIRQK